MGSDGGEDGNRRHGPVLHLTSANAPPENNCRNAQRVACPVTNPVHRTPPGSNTEHPCPGGRAAVAQGSLAQPQMKEPKMEIMNTVRKPSPLIILLEHWMINVPCMG